MVDGVRPGKWKLVADAGEAKGELEIDVPDDGLEGVEIQLETMGKARGKVVDASGAGLADMKVVLVDQARGGAQARQRARFFGPSGASSQSDDHGAFEVEGLEDGDYLAQVVSGKKALSQVGAAQDEATDGVPVKIEGGVDVDGIVLTVDFSRGQITGIVRGEGGRPQADVWVRAVRAKEADQPWSSFLSNVDPALTDVDGRFVLEDLDDGNYELTAEAADVSVRGEAKNVAVGSEVTIDLARPARIEGVVRRGGKPVTTFQLGGGGMFMGGFGNRRVVNAQGEFSMERLEPGHHAVVVTADGGSARADVDVAAGETAHVELELVDWGKVKGRAVSAESGEPVAGLTVMAFSQGGTKSLDTSVFDMLGGGGVKTDEDGRFEVGGLGPGRVSIAFTTGALTATRSAGGSEVQLEAGKTADAGDIKVLEGGETIPEDDQGDLGMWVSAADKPPEGDIFADKPPAPPEGPIKLWVLRVDDGGPASKAGLTQGDEITTIDGRAVDELGAQTAGMLLDNQHVRRGQAVTLTLADERKVTVTAD